MNLTWNFGGGIMETAVMDTVPTDGMAVSPAELAALAQASAAVSLKRIADTLEEHLIRKEP
jgi:hypothetical protein